METQAAISTTQEDDQRIFQGVFLNVPEVRIEHHQREVEGKSKTMWTFTPVISNDGNTPTGEVKYVAGFRGYFDGRLRDLPTTVESLGVMHGNLFRFISQAPSDRNQFPDDLETLFTPGRTAVYSFVGANGKREITSVSIVEDALSNSIRNGWLTFLFGEGKFIDAFDPKITHITKFCFRLTGEDRGDGFNARAVLCDYWNCTDKGCDNSKSRYDRDLADDTREHPGEPLPPKEGMTLELSK
jgi:hypothetical protein